MSPNRRFSLFVLASYLLAAVLIYLRGRSIISDATDGFTAQIIFILNTNVQYWDALSLVHVIRLLDVFPLVLAKSYAPALEPFLLLIYALPLFANDVFKNKYRYFFLLIFFLPLFISFRSFVSTCGVAYLYLYLFKGPRPNWLFVLSILFAQLSSSIVLMVLIILGSQFVFKRYEKVRKSYFFVSMVFLLASLIISILKKIPFFNQFGPDRDAMADSNAITGNTLVSALMRNTISDSVSNNQPSRYIFYFILLGISLFIIYDSFKKRNKVVLFFFLPSLLTFMFEGLGPLSMSIPYFFYFVLYPNESTDHVQKLS